MNEQTNPMLPTDVPTPIPPARPARSMRVVWMVLIGIVVLAGAAYGWMKLNPSAPVALESASPSPTATADPTAGWKTYINTQYGFEFKYPSNYNKRDDISVVGVGGTQLLALEYASGGLRVSVVNKIFDPNNIQGLYEKIENPESFSMGEKTAYGYLDGDAGCGAAVIQTGLEQKTLQLSFGACDGDAPPVIYTDKVLQTQILATFKFTTPTSSVPADWKNLSSKYFTLSFKVPLGFVVADAQNSIGISEGPRKISDIGGSNTFFGLSRYGLPVETKSSIIALQRRLLKNIKESQIIVDGSSFLMIRGDDYGRYEGDSAGKVVVVFFDASWLQYVERPGVGAFTDTNNEIGDQILSTFKFTR